MTDRRRPKLRERLAIKIADRLAETYRRYPALIAGTCDDELDRSGNLLGWLREYARLTEGAD